MTMEQLFFKKVRLTVQHTHGNYKVLGTTKVVRRVGFD